MAEQSGDDKYIKCSHCKCKYINDDNHNKTDFGYNRLNERFKTCVTCRERHKQYVSNNKDKVKEGKARYRAEPTNQEKVKISSKQYREANRQYLKEKIICNNCCCAVSKNVMSRHKESKKCMNHHK